MNRFSTGAAAALAMVSLAFPTQAQAVGTAGGGPATLQKASKSTASVPVPKDSIAWGPCASSGLQRRGAECAYVSVPLNYAKPSGKKIKIAISRIKHKVPDAEYQGVMLVNPGGPGGSGLTLSVLGEYVPGGAGNAYDWIGFDPRGVGSSIPAVSCEPNYAGFNRPPYVPGTTKITRAWMAKTHAYTQACAAKNGAILNHVTTVDSAKDMNSLRKALGTQQINYYGFSYGTYLGQVFATLYPYRLRRVVFDGTVDPRKIWYKANLDQDVAFEKTENVWFSWLAKYDNVYHLGKTRAAVRKLFFATERQLYKTPAQGKQGLIGGSEWADAFLWAGYYQATWLDLGQVFSDFINKHDVAALEGAYLDASGYGDDNGYAMYLAVQCTDVQWPKSWTRWRADNWEIYAKAPFETWGNAWYNEPCRHWPAKAHKPVTVRGGNVESVLMINETLDAATPYPGSLEVRRRFPGARLIAEPGGTTHAGSLNGNECVDNRIAAYLATGALPARVKGNRADLICQPLPQPVPVGASTAARSSAAAAKASQVSVDAGLRKAIQKLAVAR